MFELVERFEIIEKIDILHIVQKIWIPVHIVVIKILERFERAQKTGITETKIIFEYLK